LHRRAQVNHVQSDGKGFERKLCKIVDIRSRRGGDLLAAEPHLPPAERHQLYHIDLGLLLYALISLAIFGLISYWGRS
jgi:hypothetical protein